MGDASTGKSKTVLEHSARKEGGDHKMKELCVRTQEPTQDSQWAKLEQFMQQNKEHHIRLSPKV